MQHQRRRPGPGAAGGHRTEGLLPAQPRLPQRHQGREGSTDELLGGRRPQGQAHDLGGAIGDTPQHRGLQHRPSPVVDVPGHDVRTECQDRVRCQLPVAEQAAVAGLPQHGQRVDRLPALVDGDEAGVDPGMGRRGEVVGLQPAGYPRQRRRVLDEQRQEHPLVGHLLLGLRAVARTVRCRSLRCGQGHSGGGGSCPRAGGLGQRVGEPVQVVQSAGHIAGAPRDLSEPRGVLGDLAVQGGVRDHLGVGEDVGGAGTAGDQCVRVRRRQPRQPVGHARLHREQ